LSALDSRAVRGARTLAYHDGLADFAFAMQGLGSGAITLAGSDISVRGGCPRWRAGRDRRLALSEPTPVPMSPR
jgi:acyl-CoA dehydrogenase